MFGIDDIAIAAAMAEAAAAAAPAAAAGAGAVGAGAGLTGGLLGAAEAGAAGAGLLGAGEVGAGMAGGIGTGMYGIPLAGEAMPMIGASGALSFTTPSVFQTGSGLSGLATMPNGAEVAPSLLGQLGGYADQAGKAASTYAKINGAMGGGGGARPAPQAQPIFQGQAPQITPQQQAVPENQFARMLLEKRMRGGMLG